MLLQAHLSQLLIIDLQTQLMPHIAQSTACLNSSLWLCDLARTMNIPTTFTEQYPKGLGPTHPLLLQRSPNAPVFPKTYFSAYREAPIAQHIKAQQRSQVLIAGAETHVCVLQTAMHLLTEGYAVFIVDTAVGSRRQKDKQLALQRLVAHGAEQVTLEMIAFEWLEHCQHQQFKAISQGYIKDRSHYQ